MKQRGDSNTAVSADDEQAAGVEVNTAIHGTGDINGSPAVLTPRVPLGTGAGIRKATVAGSAAGKRRRTRARSRGTKAAVAKAMAAPIDTPKAQAAIDRVTRQRARILDAAERCFIERGFHAASMAHIAATAAMSAGLIYRYFDGKNQIVQAIIARHLETDGCPAMGRLNTREDFCTEVLQMFERWRRRDDPHMNAALMLELTAEAARDPEILRITRGKDRTVLQRLVLAVQRAARAEGVHLTSAAAQMRSVVLQCLVEGLACRAVRDPELSVRQLKPLVAKLVAALLS